MTSMLEGEANGSVPEEPEYERFLETVCNGETSAKGKLAWFLLSGHGGTGVDAKKAVGFLSEVVESDPEAMWMLGVCKEYGIGTENDLEGAQKLYDQSQRSGNAVAAFLLSKESEERQIGSMRIERL